MGVAAGQKLEVKHRCQRGREVN